MPKDADFCAQYKRKYDMPKEPWKERERLDKVDGLQFRSCSV